MSRASLEMVESNARYLPVAGTCLFEKGTLKIFCLFKTSAKCSVLALSVHENNRTMTSDSRGGSSKFRLKDSDVTVRSVP